MPKKVYELAKELNVSSKVLLDKLKKILKIDVKSHMTTLEDNEVDAVLRLFGLKKDEPEAPASVQNEVAVNHEVKEEKNSHEKVEKNKNEKPESEKHNKEHDVKVEKSDEYLHIEDDESENIKMDKADELLIEEYLNKENDKKIEKIGSKAKQVKNQKVDKVVVKKQDEVKVEKVELKKVIIPESITVKELAEKLGHPAAELMKKLLILGIMATINHELDFDTAALIATEFGAEVELEYVVTDEERLLDEHEDNPEDLQTRPPIVVVMGHVDHGKTSLLDAIRETNVTEGEAGGITQHIGAYSVNIKGRKITFLDTPGHEAFTAMRARGAQATDIAILVVAADDGVMPQTIEAIDHAKAAGIPIIVAVNKIDKPGADPQRVKQELTEYGLVAEEWGGETIAVPVSAKQRTNIDQLLEMVLLVADMNEIKANPNRLSKGTVIESRLDKGKGPVATLLIQNGTLSVGDAIIAGTTFGRIRAMIDDKGLKTKKAKPSMPVEIHGLSDIPKAGDIFYAVTDEKLAKQVVEKRRIKERETQIGVTSKVSLEQLFNQIQQGKVKDLNLIIKADVQGSVEAMKQSLEKLSNDEVRVCVIHKGAGAINESDVMLAAASNAIIIGFNVRPDSSATSVADKEKVDIRLYSVIYNAIEDVETAMKGMLDPEYKEVILGHAEIRSLFKLSSVGTIAGCYILDGKVTRNSEARIIRDGIVAYQGSISTLKRFKDDAKEVATGYECGITLDKFNDLKEGDVIESFVMEEIAR